MAAFATLVCQRNCGFSLQRHKTREFGEAEFSDCLPVSSFASGSSYFSNSLVQKRKNSAKQNSWIVCRFPPMKPAVWGFGLGLLGGQGFIGAKASLDPLCRAFVAQSFAFAVFATLICQINSVFPCKDTKLQNSAKPNSGDSLPVSSFASGSSYFSNSLVQKRKNSAKQNSWIVCRFPPMKPAVWGFGLGLLGGQGFIGAKASLDPLCRAFAAQSFVLAAFATLLCQRNCGFSLQRHKT